VSRRPDGKTKIIHTAVATAANVSDVAILPDLLYGERGCGATEPIRANTIPSNGSRDR